MRKAVVSGSFYAVEKKALLNQIENCFRHKLGCGLLTKKTGEIEKKKIYGIISSHAGYMYCGPCMSHAYKKIIYSQFPKTFIIFGPNHTGINQKQQIALSLEDFETPLGIAKNDTNLGKKILQALKIEVNDKTHIKEHSIEVQLPFLQYISNIIKKNFKIVPIVVSAISYNDCKKIALIITEIVKKNKGECCFIASSDMTHYGPVYGFLPFAQNIKENLYKLDNEIIEYILKLNGREFYNNSLKTTICGTIPITIVTEAVRSLGSRRGKLLKYYTSGDITSDFNNVVGYASLVFE